MPVQIVTDKGLEFGKTRYVGNVHALSHPILRKDGSQSSGASDRISNARIKFVNDGQEILWIKGAGRLLTVSGQLAYVT